MEMVGFTSPFSIWASMLRDTPVSRAASSRVSRFSSRSRLAFSATTVLISNFLTSLVDKISD